MKTLSRNVLQIFMLTGKYAKICCGVSIVHDFYLNCGDNWSASWFIKKNKSRAQLVGYKTRRIFYDPSDKQYVYILYNQDMKFLWFETAAKFLYKLIDLLFGIYLLDLAIIHFLLEYVTIYDIERVSSKFIAALILK